jgi:hypothetical protein
VNGFSPPIIVATPEIAAAFDAICAAPDALEALEESAHADDLEGLPMLASSEWANFSAEARQAFAARDHVLIKGLPVSVHGATLLLAAKLARIEVLR